MKTLFMILKATTGITLVTPTLLSVTQDFQKYNTQDENKPFDQVVNTSSTDSNSPLNNVLEGQGESDENFSNFKNNKMQHESYNKTVHNDNSKDVTGDIPGITDPSGGLADDRFGGGLFFDIGSGKDGFNQNIQNKINKVYQNGVFSDSNYMSIDHVMSPDKGAYTSETLDEANTIDQKTLNANNIKTDVHPTNQRDDVVDDHPGAYNESYQDIHQYFNNAMAPSADVDNIATSKDFNYTPNNIKTAKGSIESKTKTAMKTLFNEELYDWYWQTWGRNYGDQSVADANVFSAGEQQNALDQSGLMNDVKINLNLSWNQLIAEKQEIPWYEALLKDFGIAGLGTALDTVIPGLGAIAGGALDFLSGDYNEIYKDIKQFYDYYSPAFNYKFWSEFFDQYLGTPDNKYKGLIQQYYQKYGEYPSDININNFDFYTPFSDININSTHRWVDNDWGTNNYSSSNINLSSLILNLGVDFNLTRTDHNIFSLLSKLRNIKTLDLSKTEFGYDPSGAHKGHYYVDNTNKFQNTHYHNEHMILNALKGSGYSEIIPNLTLEGELIPGQVSYITAKYDNPQLKYKDTFSIPVEIS